MIDGNAVIWLLRQHQYSCVIFCLALHLGLKGLHALYLSLNRWAACPIASELNYLWYSGNVLLFCIHWSASPLNGTDETIRGR